MTVRHINLLLWSATCLLGAAAAAVLAGGLLLPLELAPPIAAPSVALPSTRSTTPPPSFAAIVNRQYRSPLDGTFTAAAAPVAKDPNSAPANAIQLTGVIGSLAILRGPDGSDAIAEIGDDVNGDPVVAIRPTELDLRSSSGILTLHLIMPPETTQAASPATEPSQP